MTDEWDKFFRALENAVAAAFGSGLDAEDVFFEGVGELHILTDPRRVRDPGLL